MDSRTKSGFFSLGVGAWCLMAVVGCLASGSFWLALLNAFLVGLNVWIGWNSAGKYIQIIFIPKLKDRIEFKW